MIEQSAQPSGNRQETGLPTWTIYDHPKDYPDGFIARQWIGDQPTSLTMVANDIEHLRAPLRATGLIQMVRHPSDDPCIVETWI